MPAMKKNVMRCCDSHQRKGFLCRVHPQNNTKPLLLRLNAFTPRPKYYLLFLKVDYFPLNTGCSIYCLCPLTALKVTPATIYLFSIQP